MIKRERHNAYKLVLTQAIVVCVASALFMLFSVKMGYSLLLGGLCCVLPSFYFAHKFFRYFGAQMTKQILRTFYLSEIVKLVMIGMLSILVFKFVPILPLYFFIGFIFAQFSFWLAPFFPTPKRVGGQA